MDGKQKFVDALRRYIAIQEEAAKLYAEKKTLREQMGAYLDQQKLTAADIDVDGVKHSVLNRIRTVVHYDEAILRERLGDRYGEILEVDFAKAKAHPEIAAPLLAPALGLIGSPSRDRIRAAIEAGKFKASDFAGAFTKETVRRFMVKSGQSAVKDAAILSHG